MTGQLRREGIADALDSDDPGAGDNATAKAFRAFANRTGADLKALAAIQRSRIIEPWVDGAITVPTLVLVGDQDTLVGSPQPLADAIEGAQVKIVKGDHLTAVYDPEFPKAIVDFLA